MKRLVLLSAALVLMALATVALPVPSANADEWTRCGNSLTAKHISCPEARRFAHKYLRYYYASPIPRNEPGGFNCSNEMLNVGRFEHVSCARIRNGLHQRVRFFFVGTRLEGPRDYWKPCGVRSRIHGPSCAEARKIGSEFLEWYEQGRKTRPEFGEDGYYCSIRHRKARYGPIYCVADVGFRHQSTFTEWKILFSFQELRRGRETIHATGR